MIHSWNILLREAALTHQLDSCAAVISRYLESLRI